MRKRLEVVKGWKSIGRKIEVKVKVTRKETSKEERQTSKSSEEVVQWNSSIVDITGTKNLVHLS